MPHIGVGDSPDELVERCSKVLDGVPGDQNPSNVGLFMAFCKDRVLTHVVGVVLELRRPSIRLSVG
jgi:hypothetical protein